MEKRLKIIEPMLKGRLHIAYPMISFMQHKDGKAFLFNCMLNLECFKNRDNLDLCFVSQVENENGYGFHHLNVHKEYNNFTDEKNMELVDAIIDEIDQGNYIYIAFDDYYLPYKDNFHLIHINMIYGYDEEKKILISIGYDNEGKYRTLPIPFDIARKAFLFKKVEVYRPNFEYSYNFDKKFFFMQMEDFLNAQNRLITEEEMNAYHYSKRDFCYGIDVYDRVMSHIIRYTQGHEIDFRNFHQIYEFSYLNQKRMNYLKTTEFIKIDEEILNLCETGYSLALLMRNHMIKCMIKNEHKDIDKILNNLKKHKSISISIYEKILKINKL